jgi:hypothetical protein
MAIQQSEMGERLGGSIAVREDNGTKMMCFKAVDGPGQLFPGGMFEP